MIKREACFIPSTNGHNNLHVMIWQPEGTISAVLQISHGMVEHIMRYDSFAHYLATRGILVVANDHLGHGKSVSSDEELGYFNAANPSQTVVDDLYQITTFIKKQYPKLPYFVLGHSMGSFIIRRYMMTYGKEIDGAIIMGTGQLPKPAIIGGFGLLSILKAIKGERYRSKLVSKLSFGSYNKQFKPARTPSDWLTKDTACIDTYLADPYCSFLFTLNGYETLFKTFSFIGKAKNIHQIPHDLPLLFVSGSEDPVGNNGKVVTQIYNRYKAFGIKDIQLKLYENDRHELLHELDYELVYEDLYSWLEAHIR